MPSSEPLTNKASLSQLNLFTQILDTPAPSLLGKAPDSGTAHRRMVEPLPSLLPHPGLAKVDGPAAAVGADTGGAAATTAGCAAAAAAVGRERCRRGGSRRCFCGRSGRSVDVRVATVAVASGSVVVMSLHPQEVHCAAVGAVAAKGSATTTAVRLCDTWLLGRSIVYLYGNRRCHHSHNRSCCYKSNNKCGQAHCEGHRRYHHGHNWACGYDNNGATTRAAVTDVAGCASATSSVMHSDIPPQPQGNVRPKDQYEVGSVAVRKKKKTNYSHFSSLITLIYVSANRKKEYMKNLPHKNACSC